MSVLVVTVTCGRLPVTRRWLGSLAEREPGGYRHVVVDNGSGDGTVEWLRSEGYEVVALEDNVGIAAAWERGWRHATADGFDPEWVVKYDDDCEVLTDRPLTRLALFSARTGRRNVVGPLDVEIQPGWEPARLGPARTVDGWEARPQTHVGGIFVMVPAEAFAAMVAAGGVVEGDAHRGGWWREHGWPTLCIPSVRVAHRGLDAQTPGYRF